MNKQQNLHVHLQEQVCRVRARRRRRRRRRQINLTLLSIGCLSVFYLGCLSVFYQVQQQQHAELEVHDPKTGPVRLKHPSLLRPTKNEFINDVKRKQRSMRGASPRPRSGGGAADDDDNDDGNTNDSHTNSFSVTLRNFTNITIKSSPDVTTFYCKQRSDRTGAAIWDYFNAHAFTFRTGTRFGGACGNMPTAEPYFSRQAAQKQMLDDLGLGKQIPMIPNCPTKRSNTNNDKRTDIMLTNPYYFEWDGTNYGIEAFTFEWTHFMRRFMKEFLDGDDETFTASRSKNEFTIVAHIRRGDVDPCDLYTRERYLTNQYYIDLIREYALLENKTNFTGRVVVHSQRRSFESWSDFQDMLSSSLPSKFTVEMKLDAPLKEVWYDIIANANVFIASKSTFSTAAAILMDPFSTKIICVPDPFCHSRWIQMNQTQQHQERLRLQTMIQSQCQNITFDSRNFTAAERFQGTGEIKGLRELPGYAPIS